MRRRGALLGASLPGEAPAALVAERHEVPGAVRSPARHRDHVNDVGLRRHLAVATARGIASRGSEDRAEASLPRSLGLRAQEAVRALGGIVRRAPRALVPVRAARGALHLL